MRTKLTILILVALFGFVFASADHSPEIAKCSYVYEKEAYLSFSNSSTFMTLLDVEGQGECLFWAHLVSAGDFLHTRVTIDGNVVINDRIIAVTYASPTAISHSFPFWKSTFKWNQSIKIEVRNELGRIHFCAGATYWNRLKRGER